MSILEVIKIDVASQSVYMIQISATDTLQAYYEHIGCSTVSHFSFDAYHGCYVDDEGLFNQHAGYWSLPGFIQAIAGNGIVSGVDEEGNTASAEPEFLDWLQSCIQFYGADEAAPEPDIQIVSF
ncbi:hypothetical protein QNI19_38065 [Cytophagaceae bacterium DM2B3-1]|uniref:DUF3846 domain-containing protein n=1 Tax=Xanthocytophaga flava TaxID=3048013 RepID=A0ABT7CYE6_9BACT|nr:hypothetical protein [Xanthocytophaga flavus]MDJ1498798.1 hypothetical protein [Xanthocytophaga flavus]